MNLNTTPIGVACREVLCGGGVGARWERTSPTDARGAVGRPLHRAHSETTGRTGMLREHHPNPGSGRGNNPVRSTHVRVQLRPALPLGRRWRAVGTHGDLTE